MGRVQTVFLKNFCVYYKYYISNDHNCLQILTVNDHPVTAFSADKGILSASKLLLF